MHSLQLHSQESIDKTFTYDDNSNRNLRCDRKESLKKAAPFGDRITVTGVSVGRKSNDENIRESDSGRMSSLNDPYSSSGRKRVIDKAL